MWRGQSPSHNVARANSAKNVPYPTKTRGPPTFVVIASPMALCSSRKISASRPLRQWVFSCPSANGGRVVRLVAKRLLSRGVVRGCPSARIYGGLSPHVLDREYSGYVLPGKLPPSKSGRVHAYDATGVSISGRLRTARWTEAGSR